MHHGNIDQLKSRAPTHRHKTHTHIHARARALTHTHLEHSTAKHTQAPLHKNINACRPPPTCCWLHAPLKPYSSVSLSRRNPTSLLRYFLVHPSYESLSECVNLHVAPIRRCHIRKSHLYRCRSRLILLK